MLKQRLQNLLIRFLPFFIVIFAAHKVTGEDINPVFAN